MKLLLHPQMLGFDSERSPADNCDPMTKRYFVRPTLRVDRSGNIARGFALGLAEIGCLGLRIFDVAGYPYDDQEEAMLSDWRRVGDDMRKAMAYAEREDESSDG